jgi:hypothetical protein
MSILHQKVIAIVRIPLKTPASTGTDLAVVSYSSLDCAKASDHGKSLESAAADRTGIGESESASESGSPSETGGRLSDASAVADSRNLSDARGAADNGRAGDRCAASDSQTGAVSAIRADDARATLGLADGGLLNGLDGVKVAECTNVDDGGTGVPSSALVRRGHR